LGNGSFCDQFCRESYIGRQKDVPQENEMFVMNVTAVREILKGHWPLDRGYEQLPSDLYKALKAEGFSNIVIQVALDREHQGKMSPLDKSGRLNSRLYVHRGGSVAH
jgi:hypothetical protein